MYFRLPQAWCKCRADGKSVAPKEAPTKQLHEQAIGPREPEEPADQWDYDSYYPTVLPMKHPSSQHEMDDDPETAHLPREFHAQVVDLLLLMYMLTVLIPCLHSFHLARILHNKDSCCLIQSALQEMRQMNF